MRRAGIDADIAGADEAQPLGLELAIAGDRATTELVEMRSSLGGGAPSRR